MSPTASAQAGLQGSVQRDKLACQGSQHCEADRVTPESLAEQGMLHWGHQRADVSDEWAAVTLQLIHPWCNPCLLCTSCILSQKIAAGHYRLKQFLLVVKYI